MYIKIRVQWTYNDIHNNHCKKQKYHIKNIKIIQSIYKVLQIEMCHDFFKAIKGNNPISKSRPIHNVGAAYIIDRSKNEIAQLLLIGGTHNKQGSKDARVRIVVPLTLNLIKSLKYSGAVLLTASCVKSKI